MNKNNRFYYLTYGDPPSGVYFSQVLDVCRYLTVLAPQTRVQVISLLSPRLYRSGRKKIKARYPDAIVWPAMPGLHRWRANKLILGLIFLFLPNGRMMARGPLAAILAQGLRSKGKVDQVIFDGRGAYHAEWNEYDVVPIPTLKQGIKDWEATAVLKSDLRLAVSNKLADYWQDRYGFGDTQGTGGQPGHVVIPCTLNSDFEAPELSPEAIQKKRKELGYDAQDLLLVYAGSAAGWQSFSLLEGFLGHWMEQDPRVKLLFLTRTELEQLPLYTQYPDRIQKAWLPHEEVPLTLAAGDYGILIREKTVTNQVASPTKFAEYLSSGLRVLISEGLGDYTAMVAREELGFVIREGADKLPTLTPVPLEEKKRMQSFALSNFRKQDYQEAYLRILSRGNKH